MKKHYRTFLMGLVFVTLAGLLWGCSPPTAPDVAGTEANTIHTTGTGQAEAQPDRAIVTLGVETQADTAEAAMEENNEQMAALIEALVTAGIPEEQIQTQTVQLNPRYRESEPSPRDERQPPEITGYVAVNIVEVRVDVLDDLGGVIDEAVQAGGNRVQGIRFEFADPSAILDEAREAAWLDARNKAEQLAELAGVELGAVRSINESSRFPRPAAGRGYAEDTAAAVPIEPGSQTVEVTIDVSWYLR